MPRWQAVEHAAYYEVQRSTVATSYTTQFQTISGNAGILTNEFVLPWINTTASFRVRACRVELQAICTDYSSLGSAQSPTLLATRLRVTLTGLQLHADELSWQAFAGAEFYSILRSTDIASTYTEQFTTIASVVVDNTSTTLSSTPTYILNDFSSTASYRIRACQNQNSDLVCNDYAVLTTNNAAFATEITELSFNLADENGNPGGLWSDGITMWVSDYLDGKIYAYNLASKSHDNTKDFDILITAGNDLPYGIWSDSTSMWVADAGDERIYTYDVSNKNRLNQSNDFALLNSANNLMARGIWSDGETMWVADPTEDRIFAYDATSPVRQRVAAKEIANLYAGNNNISGLWSDGVTLWATDNQNKAIYAYNLETRAADASKYFLNLNHDGGGSGIWSDGDIMWLVNDFGTEKLNAYDARMIIPYLVPSSKLRQ